ncbi:MAG TPA: hypothetical protein VNO22_01015 [Planctomycetota bacterium]|nr:hypothetical protein [Planctomycetota bacterium]
MSIPAALIAFLSAPAAPSQDAPPPIAFTVSELPAGPRKGPGFRCEGETTLPDGCRLQINFYFGDIRYGAEIHRGAVLVREGRFSYEAALFPKELYPKGVLPGLYGVQVLFNPGLQGPPFDTLPRRHADRTIQVGSTPEIVRAQNAVRARLAQEVRAVRALSEEVMERLKESEGKPPDPEGWKKRLEDWRRRCLEIELRAQQDPAVRFLGLSGVADGGLEALRNLFLATAYFAAAGQGPQALQGNERLYVESEKLLAALAPRPEDLTRLRGELASEARGILRQALDAADPAAVAAARRRYVETLLLLSRAADAVHHEEILGLAQSGVAFFDALGRDPAEARSLLESLERRLQALIELFRRSP